MGFLTYREHNIVSSAVKDEITQKWLPVITISWFKKNGRRDVRFLTNSLMPMDSFREAETFAIERGKSWVDRKLGGLD
jgi:hypothetical protein